MYISDLKWMWHYSLLKNKFDCVGLTFTDTLTNLLVFFSNMLLRNTFSLSFQFIAIKNFREVRSYVNRELDSMILLKHCNVVKLLYFFYQPGKKEGEKFINLMMEYLPMSLMQYIQKMKRLGLQIPLTTIKASLTK